MIRSGKNRRPRYPDMKLYEEIVFLQHNYNGKWIVENVRPFYKPLIKPTKEVGRHLFWSNFEFDCEDIKSPKNLINQTSTKGANALKEWLGINYKGNLYYEGNHCPAQVLPNCVHPKIGERIFNQVKL